MPVSFVEWEGSPQIRIGQNGLSGTRIFRVAWSDWKTAAAELVGSWIVIGAERHFINPKGFPDFPEALVEDLAIDPFDPLSPTTTVGTLPTFTSGMNTYEYARLTVTYRIPELPDRGGDQTQTVPEGTTLEYRMELSSDFVTVSNKQYQWRISAGLAVELAADVPVGVLQPKATRIFTWSRVPSPPWGAMRSLRGKVNATPYLGAPAETLLYAGSQVSKRFDFFREDAGNYWEVQHTLVEETKHQPDGSIVGWNHFRSDTLNPNWYYPIEHKGTGGKVYPTGDLSRLFQFE